MVVPGSGLVKAQAEAEGLDKVGGGYPLPSGDKLRDILHFDAKADTLSQV